jgi:hypothetical protein
VLQEAQYNFLQDYNYSLGQTTKTLQDWIDELTERNYAELQGISTSEFYSTATDDITTATTGATTATSSYTTAVNDSAAALQTATPANQEFLDVINGVAKVDPGESIRNATRDIQNMIIELDKANELTRLEGGFVEFMQGGATVKAKFDPVTGELLQSYTDSGPTPARTVTGDVIDINAFTNALNDGTDYIQGLTEFAGGTQSFLDAVLGQVSLVNPETGETKTIGGTAEGVANAIKRAEAEGYVNSGSFEGDVKDLIQALKDIDETVGTAIVADAALAKGGLVTKPTKAIIGEAGPEMVIPLNKFESMMQTSGNGNGQTLVYNAAPNASVDSEQELFTAMRRAKVVANW